MDGNGYLAPYHKSRLRQLPREGFLVHLLEKSGTAKRSMNFYCTSDDLVADFIF